MHRNTVLRIANDPPRDITPTSVQPYVELTDFIAWCMRPDDYVDMPTLGYLLNEYCDDQRQGYRLLKMFADAVLEPDTREKAAYALAFVNTLALYLREPFFRQLATDVQAEIDNRELLLDAEAARHAGVAMQGDI